MSAGTITSNSPSATLSTEYPPAVFVVGIFVDSGSLGSKEGEVTGQTTKEFVFEA